MLDHFQHGSTTAPWIPHGTCLVWNHGLMGLHIAADGLIALAYYSIPFSLALLVRRRTDLVYRWMFQVFAAFILACGTTHLLDIWVLWHPDYVLQGAVKAITAAVSVVAAVSLRPVVRHALALPSPAQLARINAQLGDEIASRRQALAKLEAEAAEREHLEQRLRCNEARLRAILDTAAEGIVTIDAKGRIELCNPAAARMFGYSAAELLGSNINRLIPDCHREAHDPQVADAQTDGGNRTIPCERELVGARRDGSTFPIEATVGGFENGGQYFTGILRDVSERKALEERLQRQQAELLHAQRLSTAGELAATMAHELNQPLGAIANYLGGVTLRYHAVLDAHPGLRDALQETLRLSKRAAEVVHGIRDLVRRHESGREWVAIGAVADEALALTRSELTRHKVRVVLEIPASVPPVWGQRVHFRQLLLNLVLNALDALAATAPERRELRITAHALPPAQIGIEVADNGMGFAMDLAGRIFEPFVSAKTEGIGLGLSICRTIVEAHGGRITARSVVGEGATFSITLPVGTGRTTA